MNHIAQFAAHLRRSIEQYGEDQSNPQRRALDDLAFDDLARQLFALQFEHNAFYRSFCGAQDKSPGMVHNWTEVPAIPAAAFKEGQLTCLAPDQITKVFHSSGTTGHRPSLHFHSADSIRLYEASILAGFKAVFPAAGSAKMTILFLTPEASSVPHSSLVHMFEMLRTNFGSERCPFVGRAGSGGWELDLTAAIEVLENARGNPEPLGVFGTAFSFVQLLDGMSEQGRRFVLPPHSLVFETGGYKGRTRMLPRAELHAMIRRQLEPVRIVSEYGMSELSSQAYAEGAGMVFRFPPWARVRIVSAETGLEVEPGQPGLIQVFDLANAWSAMAIQTEDLGVRREHGFELLGRAASAEVRGCSLLSV